MMDESVCLCECDGGGEESITIVTNCLFVCAFLFSFGVLV